MCMTGSSKKKLISSRDSKKKSKKKHKRYLSLLEKKARFLGKSKGKERRKLLKKYYKKCSSYGRWKWKIRLRKFANLPLPLYLSFVRWIIIDFLRGTPKRKFGIFQFVALPGEGKTMSMVAHMERYRKEFDKQGKKYFIASNFNYKYNNAFIDHWTDMVRISKACYEHHIPCLIAIDEVHITFDSADWKNFPPEILAMLSFNRKFGLEFLCSSQIYERIPKKIRDIANYTVICKNIGHFDRLFRCYYFRKADYESTFEGKKKKANYIKEYVASDDFRNLYNTLEQVDQMVENAQKEKDLQKEAFKLLFGSNDSEDT